MKLAPRVFPHGAVSRLRIHSRQGVSRLNAPHVPQRLKRD
jgi:hypothetical protein